MPRFLGGLTGRLFALVAVDHLVILAAVFAGCWVRLGTDGFAGEAFAGVLWRASLIAIVLQWMLHYCDLYDPRAVHRSETAVRLVQAVAAAAVVLAVLYYWIPALLIG